MALFTARNALMPFTGALLALVSLTSQSVWALGHIPGDFQRLTQAMGYVIAREQVLDAIQTTYPELASDVKKVNALWEERFPMAVESLRRHLSIHGITTEGFNQLVNALHKQGRPLLVRYTLNERTARDGLLLFALHTAVPDPKEVSIFQTLTEAIYSDRPEVSLERYPAFFSSAEARANAPQAAQESSAPNAAPSKTKPSRASLPDIRMTFPGAWRTADTATNPDILSMRYSFDGEAIVNTILLMTPAPQQADGNSLWEALLAEGPDASDVRALFVGGKVLDFQATSTHVAGHPAIRVDFVTQNTDPNRVTYTAGTMVGIPVANQLIRLGFQSTASTVSEAYVMNAKYTALKDAIFKSAYIFEPVTVKSQQR